MLDVALAYKSAVKELTGDEKNGVGEYELSRSEWTVLEHLRDILKASRTSLCHVFVTL